MTTALPHLHATIDWGDGHTTAGTVNGPDAFGNLTVSGTNTYLAAQTFPVTVNVTDDRDALCFLRVLPDRCGGRDTRRRSRGLMRERRQRRRRVQLRDLQQRERRQWKRQQR